MRGLSGAHSYIGLVPLSGHKAVGYVVVYFAVSLSYRTACCNSVKRNLMHTINNEKIKIMEKDFQVRKV